MNNHENTENQQRAERISHLQEMIAMAEYSLTLCSHVESSILCSIGFSGLTDEKASDLKETRARRVTLREKLERYQTELLQSLIPA